MANVHPTRLLTAEDLKVMGLELKLLELYEGVFPGFRLPVADVFA